MSDYEKMIKGRMISFNTSSCAPASEALAKSVIVAIQGPKAAREQGEAAIRQLSSKLLTSSWGICSRLIRGTLVNMRIEQRVRRTSTVRR